MELILLRDVDKVGRQGDVVRVRDGFARNFLIPHSLALPATRAGEKFVEEQKLRASKRREKEKEGAHTLSERLQHEKLRIEARAGEQDKLFGSVTAEDISLALSQRGYEVSKKQIHLTEPIRSLGTFTVTVALFPEVKASVEVEVVRKP